MLSGIAVTVLRPVEGAADRLGNPTHTYVPETVADVLVQPGVTDDLDADRPEGDTAALTLHFPKTYAGTLRGCAVVLPPPWEGEWRVVGDPLPYMAANCPTRWNRAVQVVMADG